MQSNRGGTPFFISNKYTDIETVEHIFVDTKVERGLCWKTVRGIKNWMTKRSSE
jgi:hypothetical protein